MSRLQARSTRHRHNKRNASRRLHQHAHPTGAQYLHPFYFCGRRPSTFSICPQADYTAGAAADDGTRHAAKHHDCGLQLLWPVVLEASDDGVG